MKNKMSIEQLYREHYQDIMYYLYRRTQHAETAKDLAQDTFMKAFNGLDSFKGHSSIRTWLYAVPIIPSSIGTDVIENINFQISL